jgi:hypothetical protein
MPESGKDGMNISSKTFDLVAREHDPAHRRPANTLFYGDEPCIGAMQPSAYRARGDQAFNMRMEL